ncbi:sulfatase family protein [Bythopirellula polymerisocia]|uniref:Arylsulfatase n=1 Tax=Bythopirellula polymerisocia TaxID=2528003 RepID=A0A5C6CB88_9BACT|nr:arylsulfatase [Bythopirellula polymerisocia]TWU21352.1 Arylsulfatase [Bythopirellula polymerisocia]
MKLQVVSLAFIVLLFSAAVPKTLNAAPKAITPKNVVIIVADDVGTGDVKCYGSETIDTPNIDRLADEGLLMRAAYTTCSVCNPTRYSIMTGRLPFRSPFRDPNFAKSFDKGKFPLSIPLDLPTLPRFMRERGFHTAAIGKWHLGYGETEADYEGVMTPGPVDIGFDVHFGVPGNHNDRFERFVIGDSIYRPLSVEPGPARVDDPTRPAESVERIDDLVDTTLTARACEFIDNSAERPFFLYLAYCATHTHITPRADFRGRSRIGQLGDYMMELDHHVGEIIDQLEQQGVTEETLIIFTSDNGGQENDVKEAGSSLTLADETGEVALKARTAKRIARTKYGHKTNGPLRGYKGGIHEGGFRVPCIARWPAGIKAGIETEAAFSLVDLFATIANLVADNPEKCGEDSIDQSAVLLGENENGQRRTTILNAPNGRLAVISGSWKLLTRKPVKWKADTPKLDSLPIELYDLANDPYEKNNLASSRPELIEQLKAELKVALVVGADAQSH